MRRERKRERGNGVSGGFFGFLELQMREREREREREQDRQQLCKIFVCALRGRERQIFWGNTTSLRPEEDTRAQKKIHNPSLISGE